MTSLEVFADAEQQFNLDFDKLVGQGTVTGIGLLRHGTAGGKASVSLVITLRDGKQVHAETTWALFRLAYRALAASPIAKEEVDEP